MPSANIVNGMQMLVQKIVAGLFSLVFLVFNTWREEKISSHVGKTCTGEKRSFLFDSLDDELSTTASVRAVRRDLSSSRAVKSCPQRWCLWLFYFLKYRVGLAGRKLRQMGASKKEHDSRVFRLRHSPAENKGRRRKLLHTRLSLREYLCLLPPISLERNQKYFKLVHLKMGDGGVGAGCWHRVSPANFNIILFLSALD